jgi:alkanesulfonate monooxygenase SsuD/methylene tetrahydromethanopterin reductase-like flavin-dependent oxidoreductase (luciferase family)
MFARSMLFLLIAAVAAAFVVGCGGGSDDSSTTAAAGGQTIATSSLSKEEFIKKAEAACQRAGEDTFEQVLLYLQGHEKKNATRADEAALFAQMTKAVVIPVVETKIAAIRKLGAPSGDEEEVQAFLSAQEEEIAELSKLTHIVSRFQMERYFTPSTKLGIEYGLDECTNSEPQ